MEPLLSQAADPFPATENFVSVLTQETAVLVRERLIHAGLYLRASDSTGPRSNLWRIATEPFALTQAEFNFIEGLGEPLLAFYRAAHQLYLDSVQGKAPAWVAAYLDQGKPEVVIATGRMNRFKQACPMVIRPDLILTPEGMIATELDSVPGGIGLTAALAEAYAIAGHGTPIGAAGKMVAAFEQGVRSLTSARDPLLAIVVSEESNDYWPEMDWLAQALCQRGLRAATVRPEAITFTEEGLFLEGKRIDILYRFFELFDLPNIPKSELMLYAAKKKRVILTPPPKAHLEEKSLYALFHHPLLCRFWMNELGEEIFSILRSLFPKTWLLDPREIPPHGVIPDLFMDGEPVAHFDTLRSATQKGRQFAIKPSGFSPLAWGSRGVAIGHDLSQEGWEAALTNALARFSTTPHLIQAFHKGRKEVVSYFDFEKTERVNMEGRVRLCPYYFVQGDTVALGGILATICSLEKKLIHGMVDAVMAPCVVLAGG